MIFPATPGPPGSYQNPDEVPLTNTPIDKLDDDQALVVVALMQANQFRGLVGSPRILSHAVVFDASVLGPEALAQCVQEAAKTGGDVLELAMVSAPMPWR